MDNQKKQKTVYLINQDLAFRSLDLLSLYMYIYASTTIVKNSIFGMALFICGFAAETFLSLQRHRFEIRQHKAFAALTYIIAGLAFISVGGILYIYPVLMSYTGSVTVILIAALLVARSSLTQLLVIRLSTDRRRLFIWISAVQVSVTLLLLIVTGLLQNWSFAAKMAGLSVMYPIAVFVFLQRTKRDPIVMKADYHVATIWSYRLYYALLLCSSIALYLSVMSYAGTLLFLQISEAAILPMALWPALVFSATVILSRLIKKGRLKYVEKSSLFLLGGIIWLAARDQLNKSIAGLNPQSLWFWSFMQAAGLALMMLLVTYMQEDMHLVLELSDNASEQSVKTFRQLVQQTALLISGLVTAVELCIISLIMDGRIPLLVFPNTNDFYKWVMWLLDILPIRFVLLSMFFALLQPINHDIVRKLQLYQTQKQNQNVNQAFEQRLQNLLVKRHRRRFGVKLLILLIKPFWHHKVLGIKNVDLSGGPVIFVANHREIYGPIIANLYIPFSFRPWIEHRMLDRKEIIEYTYNGTFSHIKPKWLGILLMKVLTPLIVWALNSVEPIPVYRDGLREVIKTIDISVTALQEQDNLLIFPEDPSKTESGRYVRSGVSPLYTGFVKVAKNYYKQTGQTVVFYPVYADPRKRTLTFGEGITYNPQGKHEGERICTALEESMNRTAEAQNHPFKSHQ